MLANNSPFGEYWFSMIGKTGIEAALSRSAFVLKIGIKPSFALLLTGEIVLPEPALGHLRFRSSDVPSGNVRSSDCGTG